MKKKLLFVLNHFEYSNGVASALKNLLLNLDYNSFSVDVLPLYRHNREFSDELKDKVTFIKGLGFYFRGVDKFMMLFPLKTLLRSFVKEKYDLVISYQYGLPTKMLSLYEGKKICWIHTYDEGLTLRKYYEKYDKTITVSEIGMKKLIKDGFKPEKCSFCYNIIDETQIIKKSLEPSPIAKNKELTFVTVARMDPDKGYLRLVECINKIKHSIQNTEFWFVGCGKEYKKVKKLIAKYKLFNMIKLCGKQKNPFSIMKNADIYLCASYREGFSTSCQEAAILGLPVISVDVDGAYELQELTNAGMVFENSEKGLTESISFIAHRQDSLKRWSQLSAKNAKLFYKETRMKCFLDRIKF